MTLSRMGIYRGKDFSGHREDDSLVGQYLDSWVRWRSQAAARAAGPVCVIGECCEVYAEIETTRLAQFREWVRQLWQDNHGEYWVVTPREGDPRTMDVQQGVIVVAWYGTPGLRESVEYGPVLPEKLEELIAGIEQEWFEEDVDEMNWDAIRRDEEPEEGMVEIDMVRRPCELASPWKRHQWQQQYGGE